MKFWNWAGPRATQTGTNIHKFFRIVLSLDLVTFLTKTQNVVRDHQINTNIRAIFLILVTGSIFT